MMKKLTIYEKRAIKAIMSVFKDSSTGSGRAIAALMAGLDATSQGVTCGNLDLKNRALVQIMIQSPEAIKVMSRMIYSGLDIEEAIAHENNL